MAATDVTPADLGVRSSLLVDKHAEYIRSFTRLWEVRDRSFSLACLSSHPSKHMQQSNA